MRDILPTLDRWLAEGRRFAIATVVRTWGSSPRPVGASMGVRDDGLVVGSVSGGCVEAAVVEKALECLRHGRPEQLSFGSIDESTLWEVGLSCGGRIDVWIEPEPSTDPRWRLAAEQVRTGRPAVIVTRLEPFERAWLGSSEWPFLEAVRTAAQAAERSKTSREFEIEGASYFIQAVPARERLIIVGASHIAVPLVRLAKVVGFEILVIDPRAQLLDPQRFEEPPDEAIHGWPEPVLAGIDLTEETYAVVLSHNSKIDDSAVAVLLRSPAAYIGALGSRSTQEERNEGLRALGFGDADLARIHGPVGLDIGARSPEEIALSIVAEIVKVRRERERAR